MNDEQFQTFKKTSCVMYARVSPFFKDVPIEKALEQIYKDFDAKAPEGHKTPGQFFVAVTLGGKQIGYLQLGEYPKGTTSLFGWNFHIIYEPFQKQGHGKSTMDLAKSYFKERGYSKVALNVLSNNSSVIRLYEKFGFKVTQLNMENTLY